MRGSTPICCATPNAEGANALIKVVLEEWSLDMRNNPFEKGVQHVMRINRRYFSVFHIFMEGFKRD